jgi:hypothetical protein
MVLTFLILCFEILSRIQIQKQQQKKEKSIHDSLFHEPTSSFFLRRRNFAQVSQLCLSLLCTHARS